MLKILVDILKPRLKVGLKEFKLIIGKANAKKYENDPIEMLNAMERAYNEIAVSHNGTYDNYMDDLFRALKTFPNRIFVDYVTRLKDDWEADDDVDTKESEIDNAVTKVRNKYNNMKARETWDYVDPADAKIMALATNLESLQKQLDEEKSKNLALSKNINKQTPFDIRRTQYVGDATTLDGVDHMRCNKGHKSHASPDGMYMPAGHDHDKWLEERKKKRNGGGKSGGSSNPGAAGKKLIPSDKMKSVLMTKAGFSETNAEDFIKESF